MQINNSCKAKAINVDRRAGDHPGPVDCTSKIHSSTLGPEEKVCLYAVRNAGSD